MKKRRWKRSKNSVQRDRQADADSFPFHSSANTPSHKKEEAKPSITSSATHASRRGSIRPVQGAQAIHGRLSARRPAGRPRDGGVSNPPEQGNDRGGGDGDCGGGNGGSARQLGRVRASFVLADAADCERSRSRAREYDAEEEEDCDDAKITAPALMSRTEIHEEGRRRGRSRMHLGAGDGQRTHQCHIAQTHHFLEVKADSHTRTTEFAAE